MIHFSKYKFLNDNNGFAQTNTHTHTHKVYQKKNVCENNHDDHQQQQQPKYTESFYISGKNYCWW